MSGEFAIAVIGYNRKDCLLRLLDSLNKAEYDCDIPLIISLDNCGNESIKSVADDFVWSHGEKTVVLQKERLGLKRHVLSVGEWTSKYENLIVFEDDLFVSPFYFSYVKECVRKYGNDSRIAGIGLYNQNLYQEKCYPFEAVADGYDVYFMQYACSWGQVWSRDKWRDFISWYSDNSDAFSDDPMVPPNVNKWNDKSWLKYHVKYCAENEKFFVYPRVSLTTNFSYAGSHAKYNDNSYQIPVLIGKTNWNLSTLDESNSVYDAFYENLYLANCLGLESSELCVDTYGTRNNSMGRRFWLTTKSQDFKVVDSFALDFRPRDANIIFHNSGEVIKLYDTSVICKNTSRLNDKQIQNLEMHYIIKATSIKQLFRYCFTVVFDRIKDKLKVK